MKNFAAVLCVLLTILSLAGCHLANNNTSAVTNGETTTTASSTASATTTTSADKSDSSTAASGSGNSTVTILNATTTTTTKGTDTDTPANRTYKNPVIRTSARNTWSSYGVGDPFVMRWNGRYYLYCSTKDNSVGIQCWTSNNLITWSYAGLCATEPLTASAYAPEVVYYNGYFYMYTSPGGNGHYVLKSDSPLGPFTAVTDNVGLSIDGDVFIDDDGQWYFYHAGIKGIVCHPMTAPNKIEVNTAIETGSYMNGWTEGSAILKYNGIYYMTYCGNHVWCPGYRINYATSLSSPTTFTPAANNPVLLSTSEDVKGIGHNSLVLAPDLDGYYLVYHSYTTVPRREMNVDRIVLNGTHMDVLGPTITHQEAPAMPDIYSRFNTTADLDDWTVHNASIKKQSLSVSAGGWVLSKKSFSGRYSAEFNLLSIEKEAGALFGYTDDQNFGSITYAVSTQKLTIAFTVKGKTTKTTLSVTGSFGDKLSGNALLLLTVRRVGNTYTFFVNNRQVHSCESTLGGGAIGVTAISGTATIGFVGGSNQAMQSAVKDLHKPIEGTLPAITCTEENPAVVAYDGVSYVTASANKQFRYLANVNRTAAYDVSVVYRSSVDTVLAVYQGDTAVGQITLKACPSADSTALARGFSLTAGMGEIRILVVSGSADILSYTFWKAESIQTLAYTFSDNDQSAAYTDGVWSVENGMLTMTSDYGKYLVGNEGWGDYTAEVTLTTDEKLNFGLLIRATDPSSGGLEKSDSVGSDFLRGYFIGLGNGSVFLGKHNYDWTSLVSCTADVRPNTTYRLKVTAIGATIRVWLNGTLVIDYTDTTDPFLHGMVGFRGHDTHGTADNLTIQAAS